MYTLSELISDGHLVFDAADNCYYPFECRKIYLGDDKTGILISKIDDVKSEIFDRGHKMIYEDFPTYDKIFTCMLMIPGPPK